MRRRAGADGVGRARPAWQARHGLGVVVMYGADWERRWAEHGNGDAVFNPESRCEDMKNRRADDGKEIH